MNLSLYPLLYLEIDNVQNSRTEQMNHLMLLIGFQYRSVF